MEGRSLAKQSHEASENLRQLAGAWDHSPTFFEFATALPSSISPNQVASLLFWRPEWVEGWTQQMQSYPLVSVITPIALDHMRWLGKTVGEVAQEKAGHHQAGAGRQRSPRTSGCRGDCQACGRAGVLLDVYRGSLDWCSARPAERAPKKKCGASHRDLRAASLPISDDAIAHGLRDVRWPGRLQMIGERFVLDGCHNPHAAEQLLLNWRDLFGAEQVDVIFGATQPIRITRQSLRFLRPISREVPPRSSPQ